MRVLRKSQRSKDQKKNAKSSVSGVTVTKMRNQALRDKNSVDKRPQQTKKNTRRAKNFVFGCFPVLGRISPSNIAAAILNDDTDKISEMINANPDVLDHINLDGRTLLHQCVDNCAKLGSMYSSVALDLIKRGSSLKAIDTDGKTVLQDAHEKHQHLLIHQMIKAFKNKNLPHGSSEAVAGLPDGKHVDGDNRTCITNFSLCKLQVAQNTWKKLGSGCEAYLSMERNTHLHVVDSLNERHISTTLGAVNQLVVRDSLKRVVMQVGSDSEGATDRQFFLLEFETIYDAYLFSSIIHSVEQLKTHVE